MSERQRLESDQNLEQLFQRAGRRETPPAEIATEVRAAVHKEWMANTASIRWQSVAGWALAASLALAMLVSLYALRHSPAPVSQLVASVAVQQGPVTFLDDDRVVALGQSPQLFSNQTIVTRANSTVSLDWHNGGSLRLDRNTRLRLHGVDEIELVAGQIYFDSGEAMLPASQGLRIRTHAGMIRHVGTQFMTLVDDTIVVIRVREGSVAFDGVASSGTTVAGHKLELYANGATKEFTDNGFGKDWQWITEIAPLRSFEGVHVIEFLNWVSRETGRSLRFASENANRIAHSADIVIPTDLSPTVNSLKTVLQTTDLRSEVNGQEIIVWEVEN